MAKLLKGVARWVLALLLVLFGLTGIFVGGPTLAQAGSLSAKTFAYYAISLAAGLVLLAASLLSFRHAWRRPMALAGLAAGVVLVLNQFLGLRYQTILCFTPT